jgi:hypothetical protein
MGQEMDAKTAHIILTEYNKWRKGEEPYKACGEELLCNMCKLNQAIDFGASAIFLRYLQTD